jgi:predicted CXXCH cytochrome family protein
VAAARQGNPHQSLMPKMGAGQQQTEINVCGPCHARREAFSQAQPPAGSPFDDHYALSLLTPDLYFGDGQQSEEVFILGSFLQSKMKARGVTCSNCHEPHSGKLVAEGNAVCTQCHNEAGRGEFPTLRKANYDTPEHHHHTEGSEAAQCVSCHMPERTYMLIDPRRDHFFRKPDPLQSEAAGAPDVCTSCHTGKTAAWAAQNIAEWFPNPDRSWQDRSALIAFNAGDRQDKTVAGLAEFIRNRERPGIARATALRALAPESRLTEAEATELLKDPDVLVRTAAAGALRNIPVVERVALLTPLLSDPARSVRQAAAIEIAGAGVAALPGADDKKFLAALTEYRDSRMANSDTPESHMAMGGLALSRRQWDDAEAAFRTAAEMDPQLTQAWLVLTQIREARGDKAGTEAAFSAAIAASPKNIELLLARAEYAMRSQRADDAIAWYRRAVALDGNRADVWLGMGVAAVYARKPELALDYATKAATLAPQDPQPLVVKAMAHLILGQTADARAEAQRARALAPTVQLPQELEQLLSP